MQLKDMESGLWGVKRKSVYKYITYMEREFSSRMVEQEEKTLQTERMLRKRIDELEALLTGAQEENQKLEDQLLQVQNELQSWKDRERTSEYSGLTFFGQSAAGTGQENRKREAGRQPRLFERKKDA